MKIVFKDTFLKRLERQLRYISIDSPSRATNFKKSLFSKIRKIPRHPYSFRKSIFFDRDDVRDLIFKGYIIVFKITSNRIEVFGLVKYQDSPTD